MSQVTHEMSLRAVVAALAQLEEPLNPETQAKLKEVAQELKTDETSAIEKLLGAVEECDNLNKLKETAFRELLKDYQAQPREKIVRMESNKSSETNNLERLNFAEHVQRIFEADSAQRAKEAASRLKIEKEDRKNSWWKWVKNL